MQQVLVSTESTVYSPPFVAADGYTPTDTASTPVLVATRSDGTVITGLSVTNMDAPGVYSVALPAITQPDLITLLWTGTVSGVDQTFTEQVEVVGGFYVTVGEMWQYPDMNAAKHPPELIARLRQEFEQIAERWTGQAWVPRYAAATLRQGWLLDHPLPREILSVFDHDDVAVDFDDWLLERSGLVSNSWYYTPSQTWPITVRYVHGADRPPADLVEACRMYIRAKAFEHGNRVGRDVLSTADPDAGTTRFSTPDWNAGRPTGLLDVDRVLCSLGAPLPGIA